MKPIPLLSTIITGYHSKMTVCNTIMIIIDMSKLKNKHTIIHNLYVPQCAGDDDINVKKKN